MTFDFVDPPPPPQKKYSHGGCYDVLCRFSHLLETIVDIKFSGDMKYNVGQLGQRQEQTARSLTYLLYLGPLHEEHRPSTTSRHLTRSWAALITPFQQVSCCAISDSVLRLQLLRGRPLFLFPCGFHLRAWRVVLLVLFGGFRGV